MAFTSNLAAINAANAQLKAHYVALDKDALKAARNLHFSIEKHDGEWHALIVAPFPDLTPAQNDRAIAQSQGLAPFACIQDERSADAFAFPTQSGRLERISAHMQEAAAEQAAADALANEQALKDAQQAATSADPKAPKPWIHSSSVMKPTKLVWAIADEMLAHASAHQLPVPSRKEVQDECVRRGVASGTARTQYQAWKTARDNALKNAEHAAALSAAFNRKSS